MEADFDQRKGIPFLRPVPTVDPLTSRASGRCKKNCMRQMNASIFQA
jgi:hypothetical protein